MTESEMHLHSCCFTGHRPDKLNKPEKTVIRELECEIKKAIDDGYTTFITGMAQGVDIWAAEVVIKLRKKNSALHLICALPFPDFDKSWSEDWKKRYQAVLNSADLVKTISDHYFGAGVFMVRNKWMVDHSNRVIAVYNGTAGGTKNTIEYAIHEKKQVLQICKE